MFEIETITTNNQLFNSDDTQTIVSELSDEKSCQIKMFKTAEEINEKTLKELSKLTSEKLKDKCKVFGIQVTSKSKKMEIVELLMIEFEKKWIAFKNLNKNELKEECKKYKIKGISGLKKEELLSLLMNYYSDNLIVNLQKNEEIKMEEIKPEEIVTADIRIIEPEQPSIQLSLIEELEKQKQDIEKKMLEEIEKQRIELEEKKKQEEFEKQQIEKQQIEEERQKEKEEKKKKKQAIPKNVRNIVWNHYIGEDIIKHRCLCCKKVLITNTNFEVGHVLSEKNGGTHEINNLRPICGSCNHSMGTENMIEFVIKYGLYIG